MAWGSQWRKGLPGPSAQPGDLAGSKRGRVTIAVIDAPARGFVTRVAREVRDEGPGVVIDLALPGDGDAQEAVADRDVDPGVPSEPGVNVGHAIRTRVGVRPGIVAAPIIRRPPFGPVRSRPFPEAASRSRSNRRRFADGSPRADGMQTLRSFVLRNVGVGVPASLDVAAGVAAGEPRFVGIDDRDVRPPMPGPCVGLARVPSRAAAPVPERVEARSGSWELPSMEPDHVA